MTPVVFIHGFSGGPSAWDRTRAALARPSAAVLLPGHGLEPWLCGDRFADAVAALAERWPVAGRAIVVGYSMGARIALALAVARPSLFAHGVLVGVHPGLDDPELRAERASLDDRRAVRIEREGIDAFIADWEREELFASQRSLPAPLRMAHAMLRRAHTTRGLAWAMRTLGLGRMAPLTSAVHVPITLVTGEHDPKFCAIAATLSAARGFAHREIAGAGHDVSLEAPLELAKIIEEASLAVDSLEEKP